MKPIILQWAQPRSTSTAIERVTRERGDSDRLCRQAPQLPYCLRHYQRIYRKLRDLGLPAARHAY